MLAVIYLNISKWSLLQAAEPDRRFDWNLSSVLWEPKG